jgi:predicted DNA-binding transcriptional regulator AlpA
MTLLDYADLRQRGVKYSKCQLWRLWNAGKFPRPVKLSAVRNTWRADEIDAWIEQRIAERDQAAAR